MSGFERFKELGLQFNLSISLHAVTDHIRRAHADQPQVPYRGLLAAAESYIRAGRRKTNLEYMVVRGLNDSLDDAEGLAGITGRLKAKVNVIAYSKVEGAAFETPAESDIARFERLAEEAAEFGATIVRGSPRATSIATACGRLTRRFLDKAGPPPPGSKP